MDLEVDGFRFSTRIDQSEADALLCEWAPSDELASFRGPAAWYTCEPRTNPRMGVLRQKDQRRSLTRLRPNQLLHHAHPDPRYRGPHMTHAHVTIIEGDHPRAARACTVVSNYGGPIWNRWPDIDLRNRFATAPGVDLFGRRAKWTHFRPRWWSLPRLPESYRGEIGEDVDKLQVLSRYRVAICLENTIEPGYLSEKFVDGVRAGCVPVYRAHPSVRDTVLQGATWVDPADHHFDPRQTLEHALSLDPIEVAARNFAWFRCDDVRATSERGVWARIGHALRAQGEELGVSTPQGPGVT